MLLAERSLHDLSFVGEVPPSGLVVAEYDSLWYTHPWSLPSSVAAPPKQLEDESSIVPVDINQRHSNCEKAVHRLVTRTHELNNAACKLLGRWSAAESTVYCAACELQVLAFQNRLKLDPPQSYR